jgi:hypothetical protein
MEAKDAPKVPQAAQQVPQAAQQVPQAAQQAPQAAQQVPQAAQQAPQAAQVNSASKSDAVIQRHLDYLNNFVASYDEMGKKMMGKERQQRMREELQAYKEYDHPQVRDLANAVSAQLDKPRTPQQGPRAMLFSSSAASIHMKASSPRDPQSIAEALELCKQIVQEMNKRQNPALLNDRERDTSARVLQYIEQTMSSVTAELASRLADLNNQTKHIWQEDQNPLQKVVDVIEGKQVKANLSKLESSLEAVKPTSVKPGK